MSSFVTPSTNALAKSCGGGESGRSGRKTGTRDEKRADFICVPIKHLHNDTDMDLFCLLFIYSFIRLSGETLHKHPYCLLTDTPALLSCEI